jgi:acetoin utilization deacetylase AcuC-like enzyme
LKLPLDRGADWTAYAPPLHTALDAIEQWGAKLLIVSFGADTFAGDPISHFRLERNDFALLGAAIGKRGLPRMAVMEGGYAVAELGANVAAFLSGF